MKVLITDQYFQDNAIERQILEAAGLEVYEAQCETPEAVIEAGQGMVALMLAAAPITAEVLDALPELRLISVGAVGYDTVDIEAARERGIWVSNVPDATSGEVATHGLGLLLSLVRHIAFFDRHIRVGTWDYRSTGPLRRPASLTLGIAGLGRIGHKLAELARPVFGNILAYDPYLAEANWPDFVESVSLDALFQRSNAISLHMPLTDETFHMVDRQRLAQMPEASYLVNTGRGELVNLDDLLQALDSGQLAGAGLDALPEEPPPPDHPLIHHVRVLLTPHAAFYSLEGEEELRRKFAQNVVAWINRGLRGQSPLENKAAQ